MTKFFFCATAENEHTENELSHPCWTVCWVVQTYFTLIKCQKTVFEDQFSVVYTKSASLLNQKSTEEQIRLNI